ncbi:MAG: DUF881 domain-containing protein [Carbonactinosporaceae bacterium]
MSQPPGTQPPAPPEPPGGTATVAAAAATATVAGSGRGRVRAALWPPRVSRAQLVVAVLLALLGFGLATQVSSGGTDARLRGARESDLVQVLDDVTDRADRLSDEARRLEITRDRLQTGTDRTNTALEQARERARALGVLAGSVPATGPGIEFTIVDPQRKVDAATLVDAVNELRDAGSEAVQIGSVRVVASTSFTDAGPGRVLIDGQAARPPYRFKVIGDPRTFESALGIPGGVLDALHRQGADGVIAQKREIDIGALHVVRAPEYARPAARSARESGQGLR